LATGTVANLRGGIDAAASKSVSDTFVKIAGIKKRVQTIGQVLDLFAAVLTGSGDYPCEAPAAYRAGGKPSGGCAA